MSLDVIFISYNESNADENWIHLKSLRANAKRVHGVEGIKLAHQKAAELSETEFFFLIDGDNFVYPNFQFQPPVKYLERDAIYVWRAKNPVNGLVYGYGGVKIYSKSLLAMGNAQMTNGDLATNIAKKYIVVEELASETRFNATPLESWRGAFREVTKLTLNLHNSIGDRRTHERVESWKSLGAESLNGTWAMQGAIDGQNFAYKIVRNEEQISKINDFAWLENFFYLNHRGNVGRDSTSI